MNCYRLLHQADTKTGNNEGMLKKQKLIKNVKRKEHLIPDGLSKPPLIQNYPQL